MHTFWVVEVKVKMKEAVVCSDCGGDKFVWDRDGDMTCTGCGLVKEERYIDDRCDYQDLERVAFLIEEEDKGNGVPRELLPYIEDYDEVLQAYAEKMFTIYCKSTSSKKNDTKRAILANCLYYASIALKRSFGIEEIVERMDVSMKDFWSNLYDVRNVMKGQKFYDDIDPVKSDTLARMVFSIEGLVSFGFDKWKVIRTCHKLSDLLPNVGKKEKMNASIVYVALCACGIRVTHKEFCEFTNISLGTLKKHEASIQACLVKET
jgi:transcription initiation factor TFIIIB Brf1 subunit/transcription initiation factor TFIIB